MPELISIIIRTKNEERWMQPCLNSILNQKVSCDFEIILVDNSSTDQTVSRAKAICPDIKVIEIQKFLPGLAINLGIKASSGDYIVCLSAHCPPVDCYWLANLLRNFDDPLIAGVYGRQVPTRFTNDTDKRDLFNMFGLDRRIQIRDTFFHNANSMFPRQVWEQFPFDESITNIEDRLWGQDVIKAGFKIIYEPDASVFHHHGIHQDNRPDRARNVAKILESRIETLNPDHFGSPFDPKSLETCAIIPIRSDQSNPEDTIDLIKHTIDSLSASEYINRILISADCPRVIEMALRLGIDAPFLRPEELSHRDVRLDSVLQHCLYTLEADSYFPDVIVSISSTFPFRPPDLVDKLLINLLEGGYDTVIPVIPELRSCWYKENHAYKEFTDSSISREMRDPLYISVPGLGCVSLPHTIRKGNRTSGKVGIFEINDPLIGTEVKQYKDISSIRKRFEINITGIDSDH